MQIPIYQSRVGPATQRRDTTPRNHESAYEGVIQFSNTLKEIGGQVATIAIDNERRVRAQTMQAERSRAWRDYSEFKSQYHHQYFDPQNANTKDPETGLPMYVLGLQRVQEESGRFFNKAGENFTYSEAMEAFRQDYEQDMVKFGDAIRSQGRGIHLGVLRHEVGTNVDDAVRRRDEEALRTTLEAASTNGIISPQERADIGNKSLHDMSYRKVMEALRQGIWEGAAPVGIQELMEIVNEAAVNEYLDMDGESRRLTGEDVENLRTLARQERQFRIQDDAHRRSEADRVSNEHGQRDYRRVMRGDMTTGQMRMSLTQADESLGDLGEEHEYHGMSASTREHWHRALDAWDNAMATATADRDSAASVMAMHELIIQGADPHAVEQELFRRANNGEFSEAQYRTLLSVNASRNLNDNMSRFNRLVEQTGASLGRSPQQIMAAQMAVRDLLRENGRIVELNDGSLAVAENWNPDEVMKIVENYLADHDWVGMRERLLGPEMAGGWIRNIFQGTNIAKNLQHLIDNNGLLGVDITSEIAEALTTHGAMLTRELSGQLNLGNRMSGLSSYYDTDGRTIIRHTQTRRDGQRTRTFTYFTKNVDLKDDGSVRSADMELHMLGGDNEWHPVPEEMLRAIRVSIATETPPLSESPLPTTPRPQINAPPTDDGFPLGHRPERGSDSGAEHLTPDQFQGNVDAVRNLRELRQQSFDASQ